MQVGLSNRTLLDNDAFQNVSYGFTVTSIMVVIFFCFADFLGWVGAVLVLYSLDDGVPSEADVEKGEAARSMSSG